ncbi:hypothetical protein QAD02_009010 [Eretmocerus hayati]|uniref:Uncharacterized protein n=1 Tax=Eretmocerus hayati TaxID=131215 RepID=A0ACC2N8T5_9HYME|nr:hypothetical protein QAD02_009010 [Eretmocerus hayati]
MKWSTSSSCSFILSLLVYYCSSTDIDVADLKDNVYIEASIENLSDFVREFHQSWFGIDNHGHPIKSLRHFYRLMSDIDTELGLFFQSFENSFVRNVDQDLYLTHVRKMKKVSMQIFIDLRRIIGNKYSARLGNIMEPHLQSFVNRTLEEYSKEDPIKIIHDVIYDHFLHEEIFSAKKVDNNEYIEDLCVPHMTPSQLINKLLQYYQLAIAGHYTSQIVLRELINQSTPDEIKNSMKKIEDDLKKHYNLAMQEYINIMPKFSRVLRTCHNDADHYAGRTLFHEVKLHNKLFVETCQKTYLGLSFSDKPQCDNLVGSEMCEDLKEGGNCAVSHTCKGKMHCSNLNRDKFVCLNKPSKSRRHISSLTVEESSNSNKICKESYFLTKKEFSQYLGAVKTKCTPCQCTCVANDLYYSTDMVTTDINANKVVTGARLEIINNTLIVRIQEGKLMSTGKIDRNSVHWLPANITNRKLLGQIPQEKISLTRIQLLRQGEILTGLGFADRKESSSESYIFLQAQSNKFDFWNGTVDLGSSQKHNASSAGITNQLQLTDKDIPTRKSNDIHQNSSSTYIKRNQSVRLTVSEINDGEQRTIPFIDGRDVYSAPPMPISGTGLYFRGKETDGGFIGIELITHNSLALENVDGLLNTNSIT